jgi:hypothetical protein
MPPEQFWRLSPIEFWWQVDARRSKDARYGPLSEDDVAEIYTEMQKAR